MQLTLLGLIPFQLFLFWLFPFSLFLVLQLKVLGLIPFLLFPVFCTDSSLFRLFPLWLTARPQRNVNPHWFPRHGFQLLNIKHICELLLLRVDKIPTISSWVGRVVMPMIHLFDCKCPVFTSQMGNKFPQARAIWLCVNCAAEWDWFELWQWLKLHFWDQKTCS